MSWLLDGPREESAGARFRRILDSAEPTAVPGAFNAMSALIARKAGFEALYLSGAAFSASLGLPDVGLITLDELVDQTRRIVRASGLPVLVDADTGFGGALNVVRTVKDLEDAGAAAVQIEDQVNPKRCGHLAGKSVVPADEFAEKVRAADQAQTDLVVVARTDAKGVYGMDEAIRRARLYKEAGADLIFPEALESEDEFKAFADAVGGPLLANMTEFGKTPYISVDRFGELGYTVVIFPVTALRVAARAMESVLADLRRDGTQKAWVDRMQTRQELYQLIEYDRYQELDSRIFFGGTGEETSE